MTNKEKLQGLMDQAKELSGQISEEEMKEVVGGGSCACVLGGGGTAGGVDNTCACVLGGVGTYDNDAKTRCACGGAGGGVSKN